MSAAETTGIQTVTPTTQVVTLTIDDREVQALPGQTILEAAQAAGIEIPTLCHDPRLEPYGACRMCLVEVEGARGPMASCGTAIREGMKVQTQSEKIRKIRKFVLELLLTNHPLDCPVCEAAGDCRLQDYAYEYLVDLGVRLDEANAPIDGRFVVVPAWFHGLLLKDERFTRTGSARADAALANGEVGEAAGFTILKSNNVPNTAGAKYKILAGHASATAYVEQVVDLQTYKPEKRFGDAVKGLHVYGAKVIRADSLAMLTADKE